MTTASDNESDDNDEVRASEPSVNTETQDELVVLVDSDDEGEGLVRV